MHKKKDMLTCLQIYSVEYEIIVLYYLYKDNF